MGIGVPDIGTDSDNDNGTKSGRLIYALHSPPLDATQRAALRAASSGSDSTVRAALVASGSTGLVVTWDNAAMLDALYGRTGPSTRTLLREAMGDLAE